MNKIIRKAAVMCCTAVMALSAAAFTTGVKVSAADWEKELYFDVDEDVCVSDIDAGESGETVPQILKPKASKGLSRDFIRVTWGASKNRTVFKYVIQRRVSNSGWKTVGTVPNMVNSFDDYIKSESDNKYYQYRVRCKYVSGNTIKTSPASGAGTTYGYLQLGITIDPGHYLGCNNNYGYGGYAGSYRYSEGTQMLKLGHYLKAELEKKNVNVKITRDMNLSYDVFAPGVRNEKYNPSLYYSLVTRGNYAEDTDFFVSLHTNGAKHWAESYLWGVTCFPNDVCMDQRATSLQLAADLGQTASDTMTPGGVSVSRRAPFNRTLRVGNSGSTGLVSYHLNGKIYYTVLWGADEVGVPGILLEHSFHTNPAVRAWLLSDANLKKLAKAESRAILKHYGFPV